MKRLLFAAAFAALPLAAHPADLAGDYDYIQDSLPRAPAHGGVVGYLEAYAGYLYQDFGDEDEEIPFGAGARMAVPLAAAWSAQFDIWGDGSYDLGDDSKDYFGGLAAHLTGRSGGLLGGVFASYGYVTDQEGSYVNFGVEGGANAANFAFLGQLGYMIPVDGEDADEDGELIYGHARLLLYCNPDLVFGFEGGYFTYEDDDSDFDGFTWGASVEAKASGSPVSVFARYQGASIAFAGDSEDDIEHAGLLGLRFAFGADTIQELNEAVGLADFNPLYGVSPARVR
jgi:hypothetical protein